MTAAWTQVLLLALILVLAHSVETTLGFGATIIALALGLFIFPLEVLLPILVIVALLQSTWLVIRWHRHIRWRLMLVNILPLAVVGMVAGVLLRDYASEAALIVLVGAFVMAVSLVELIVLYRTKALAGPLPQYLAWPVILGGGVFHGLFASGGPLIVYYAGREIHRPEEFRATLSVLWLLLNVALLATMWLGKQIDIKSLELAALVLPGFIAGVIIGSFVKVEARTFKALTWSVLFIVGLVQLIKAAGGMIN